MSYSILPRPEVRESNPAEAPLEYPSTPQYNPEEPGDSKENPIDLCDDGPYELRTPPDYISTPSLPRSRPTPPAIDPLLVNRYVTEWLGRRNAIWNFRHPKIPSTTTEEPSSTPPSDETISTPSLVTSSDAEPPTSLDDLE
jgi:hypothetical protein